jgi:uncharacterized coiled-coil protein SlyX
MSDNESVSSSGSQDETIASMLARVREHQRKVDEILKQAEKMAKKVKVKAKSTKEKTPRKTSEGQRRWQSFQKFVWDQLKEENAAAPYKAAMQAAGPRWSGGEPVSEEDKTAFAEWLKTNPIPTEEERVAAKAAAASSKATADASAAEDSATDAEPAKKPKGRGKKDKPAAAPKAATAAATVPAATVPAAATAGKGRSKK